MKIIKKIDVAFLYMTQQLKTKKMHNYAINLVRFTHWTHTRTRVFAGYRNVRNI